MRIANEASIANYEWLDAIDVVNMIDACELIIHSSLERKESRGPFFRHDFPATDNDAVAGRQRPARIRQRLHASSSGPTSCRSFSPDFATQEQSSGGLVMALAAHRSRRAMRAARPDRACRHACRAQFAAARRRHDHRAGRAAPTERRAGPLSAVFTCPTRNGCASSMRSTGSPRTRRPILPIAGSAARRCAAPARCA